MSYIDKSCLCVQVQVCIQVNLLVGYKCDCLGEFPNYFFVVGCHFYPVALSELKTFMC